MTLGAALTLVSESRKHQASRKVALACGFQPLHLETFLGACTAARNPGYQAQTETGLYGDVPGNIVRATRSESAAAVVVVEWPDVDSRLGLRSSQSWGVPDHSGILDSCRAACRRLLPLIQALGAAKPAVVVAFTLPPLFAGHTVAAHAGTLELALDQLAAEFRADCAALPGVRVASPTAIGELSQPGQRLDPKMEFLAGFPYSLAHAEAVAHVAATVLFPAPPKKGVITDLDNTLWKGIVGEIGAAAISWDLASHSQAHGLYQQMLSRLAGQGVLIGVVSKNEPATVEEAFARSDLYIPGSRIFPIEAGWGRKSDSVRAVLRAWNIGPDSVVFIDDSDLELAEVKASFPEIETIRFEGNNPASVTLMLQRLRDLFGKPVLLEEDALRAASLRTAAAIEEPRDQASLPEFLSGVEGVVHFDYGVSPGDVRQLELINKTNQFNLNGVRLSEGEWQSLARSPQSVVLTVSYTDKFGRLGKIAVLVGKIADSVLQVDHWVMSCRAFSRMIEHHTLNELFEHLGPNAIRLNFQPTPRNGPLQEFLSAIGVCPQAGEPQALTATAWHSAAWRLPHRTETPALGL